MTYIHNIERFNSDTEKFDGFAIKNFFMRRETYKKPKSLINISVMNMTALEFVFNRITLLVFCSLGTFRLIILISNPGFPKLKLA